MPVNTKILFNAALLFTTILLVSCGGEKKKDTPKPEKGRIKTEVKKESEQKTQRPPIINIVDTVSLKMTVIYSSDSAATFDRISLKLGKIYGTKLPEYIKKNNLKITGAPMAWYKKQKTPFFFEAGIPVNKTGSKPVKTSQILSPTKVIEPTPTPMKSEKPKIEPPTTVEPTVEPKAEPTAAPTVEPKAEPKSSPTLPDIKVVNLSHGEEVHVRSVLVKVYNANNIQFPLSCRFEQSEIVPMTDLTYGFYHCTLHFPLPTVSFKA